MTSLTFVSAWSKPIRRKESTNTHDEALDAFAEFAVAAHTKHEPVESPTFERPDTASARATQPLLSHEQHFSSIESKQVRIHCDPHFRAHSALAGRRRLPIRLIVIHPFSKSTPNDPSPAPQTGKERIQVRQGQYPLLTPTHQDGHRHCPGASVSTNGCRVCPWRLPNPPLLSTERPCIQARLRCRSLL